MDRNAPPPARPFTFHHLHTVTYDEYYTITGHANGAASQPRQVIVNLEAPDIDHALEVAARPYITVFRPFAACFSGVGITVLESRALNDDEGLLLIEEEADRTRHVHHVPVSGSHPDEWLESANAVRYALTTNPCLQAIYNTTLEEGRTIDLSNDPDPLAYDTSREPPPYTTPYTYAALATLPAGEPRDLLMQLLRPDVIGVLDKNKRLLDSIHDAKTLAFALAELGW